MVPHLAQHRLVAGEPLLQAHGVLVALPGKARAPVLAMSPSMSQRRGEPTTAVQEEHVVHVKQQRGWWVCVKGAATMRCLLPSGDLG